MNDEAEELLMMFVKDSYKSATGSPSKKTAMALMKYVASDPELQKLVNIGDYNAITKHKRI